MWEPFQSLQWVCVGKVRAVMSSLEHEELCPKQPFCICILPFTPQYWLLRHNLYMKTLEILCRWYTCVVESNKCILFCQQAWKRHEDRPTAPLTSMLNRTTIFSHDGNVSTLQTEFTPSFINPYKYLSRRKRSQKSCASHDVIIFVMGSMVVCQIH